MMQTHECKESTHNASHKGTQDKNQVYNQLLSFYCNNACESNINLYIDILYKHSHIKRSFDTTTSYECSGTIFSIFTPT